jgi:hypothetical protein
VSIWLRKISYTTIVLLSPFSSVEILVGKHSHGRSLPTQNTRPEKSRPIRDTVLAEFDNHASGRKKDTRCMHVKRKNYRHISDHQANWDNSSNNSAPPHFVNAKNKRQEQTSMRKRWEWWKIRRDRKPFVRNRKTWRFICNYRFLVQSPNQAWKILLVWTIKSGYVDERSMFSSCISPKIWFSTSFEH